MHEVPLPTLASVCAGNNNYSEPSPVLCVCVPFFYTVQAKEESENRKEENLLIFFLDPISDAVTLTVLHGWANTLSC